MLPPHMLLYLYRRLKNNYDAFIRDPDIQKEFFKKSLFTINMLYI